MLKSREKTIDGRQIYVHQFPGIEGFKIKTKLIKLIGPALGELTNGATKDIDSFLDADLSSGFVSRAINVLCDKLDENDTFEFILRMLHSSGTRVDGREMDKDAFNEIFAGNFTLLYKIIGILIEENYGNFFGEGGIGNKLKKFQVNKK